MTELEDDRTETDESEVAKSLRWSLKNKSNHLSEVNDWRKTGKNDQDDGVEVNHISYF